eukprot:CAMPEP_0198144714 /NCGR_PEP_ID=MMETSP1443-20131203/18070_1 /TAXON_ID=186043 /ORGANISM="Entomoneis sp., Strain CCMP2396" /LENGTH=315 /DNA_ID=CAMNT_0043808165 /DNA_START=125 /DNA_END=1068 /DNA_ORIENTATION=+
MILLQPILQGAIGALALRNSNLSKRSFTRLPLQSFAASTNQMDIKKHDYEDGNGSKEGAGGNDDDQKHVIFLRHSTTFMNEYLGRSLRFGAPGFTDVFTDAKIRNTQYLDTPLSPRGIQWAKQSLSKQAPPFIPDVDLVVTSPLQRAMQTFEIGIRPHFEEQRQQQQQMRSGDCPPVLAHPDAAERLYLISDVGRPVSMLQESYTYVNFSHCLKENNDDNNNGNVWWWTPGRSGSSSLYVEWRPTGQGQRYACPGEPESDFDARMTRLYTWLQERPEKCILVVCHHGVIDWMLDMDFDNCQWKKVPFSAIRQHAP